MVIDQTIAFHYGEYDGKRMDFGAHYVQTNFLLG